MRKTEILIAAGHAVCPSANAVQVPNISISEYHAGNPYKQMNPRIPARVVETVSGLRPVGANLRIVGRLV